MSAGDDKPHTPAEGPSSGVMRARLAALVAEQRRPKLLGAATRLARRPRSPSLASWTNPAEPDWTPADPSPLERPAPLDAPRLVAGAGVDVDTIPAPVAAVEGGSQARLRPRRQMPIALARAVIPAGDAPGLGAQGGHLERDASSAAASSAGQSVPDRPAPASPVPPATLRAGGDERTPSAAPAAPRGPFPPGMPGISRQALEWLLGDSIVARQPAGPSSAEPTGVGGESVPVARPASFSGEPAGIPSELLRSRERARARARVMREVTPKRGVLREGPAPMPPAAGPASPAPMADTRDSYAPVAPSAPVDASDAASADPVPDGATSRPAPLSTGPRTSAVPGARPTPVVARAPVDSRDDTQPTDADIAGSLVPAAPPASVSPAPAPSIPARSEQSSEQAGVAGAAVASPEVRRAVRPTSAPAAPASAPPEPSQLTAPQVDPGTPTAAIVSVAVETHMETANRALSAGSSQADQPSASLEAPAAPGAGAGQAIHRAIDDRAPPSRAAESVNHGEVTEADGASIPPMSLKPAADSPPAPAEPAPSTIPRAGQASARPATAALPPAESAPAGGAYDPSRPPSLSATGQRSLSRTAHPANEGERSRATTIGAQPGPASAGELALGTEPTRAHAPQLDGTSVGASGRAASPRLHRLAARPAHFKPETTDRGTGQSAAPVPYNRPDEPPPSSGEPTGVGGESVPVARPASFSGEPAGIPSELLRSRERARARARVMREVTPKRGVLREGPAPMPPAAGPASPAPMADTRDSYAPVAPSAPVDASDAASADPVPDGATSRPAPLSTGPRTSAVPGARPTPVVARAPVDSRDDTQPTDADIAGSLVPAAPPASVSPAPAPSIPARSEQSSEQAGVAGAAVASPEVRRAVRPTSAPAAPASAPPEPSQLTAPQVDPGTPTAAIVSVAVETHMETANRALSAGSSQADQPSASLEAPAAPGAGAGQAIHRAIDDRAPPSRAAESVNHREVTEDRAAAAGTAPAGAVPERTVGRAPAAQSTPTPSRSGDPTSFVTATHTADIDGVDAGGTLAARTLARTLETAPNPADLGDGARVGELARGSLTRAPHSESAVLPSPEGTSQEPSLVPQSQPRPLRRLSSSRASRQPAAPAGAPVPVRAAETASDVAPSPLSAPSEASTTEVQLSGARALHRAAVEADGASIPPMSLQPAADSPPATAEPSPSAMPRVAQVSSRPTGAASPPAESAPASGASDRAWRPSVSAAAQRSFSRTAHADEGERSREAAIGAQGGPATASALVLGTEPSRADAPQSDGVRVDAFRPTASRRLHRLAVHPAHHKPENTDRSTDQSAAPVPYNRPDEARSLATPSELQPAAPTAGRPAIVTRWPEAPASDGSDAREPAAGAAGIVARTAVPAPRPETTAASVQRAPNLHTTTDAEGSHSFEVLATPPAAARSALSSTAERPSDDLGSKPLSHDRLDEIYQAVAERLRRELLLSRERNGSLL